MNIAVSFCNQKFGTKNNLVIYDVDKDNVDKLEFPFENNGFTGLAVNGKYLFAIYQSSPSGVVILDRKSYKILNHFEIPEMIDPHDIKVYGKKIYIVSTGTEQILEFEFDPENMSFNSKRILWQSEFAEYQKDTTHINSFIINDDNIYISAFGKKAGEGRSSANKGYVFDIMNNEFIIKNLNQPHSLNFYEDGLFFIESRSSNIFHNNLPIISIESGYPRGLAVTDEFIFIGNSFGRKVSKSTGLRNSDSIAEIYGSKCYLLTYKRKSTSISIKEFSPDFQEIYDIILL